MCIRQQHMNSAGKNSGGWEKVSDIFCISCFYYLLSHGKFSWNNNKLWGFLVKNANKPNLKRREDIIIDKTVPIGDFHPTWSEEAELLGRSRWSLLLLSWELTTDWICSSWCEVWISPPMGGKRSGCLRRLSTSVRLQVLSPFPAQQHGETIFSSHD